jgi:glutamine amidotransferase
VNIALVDYGAGNLTSVIKGLRAVGGDVHVLSDPTELRRAQALVIPGVGHFEATGALGDEWRAAVRERLDAGVPLLGICLGLQWLFEGSDEAPEVPGLGLLAGRCFHLPDTVKVPHVGWNTLERTAAPSRLLSGMPEGAMAYFTHSFAAPLVEATAASTTHGAPFTAVIEHGHVFATQFHPEKSGRTGLRLLANFMTAARAFAGEVAAPKGAARANGAEITGVPASERVGGSAALDKGSGRPEPDRRAGAKPPGQD